MVAKRRRVWVKLLGVPLHVWEERCFKDMGNFIGEFIDFDIVNTERKRLDEVRLLIYTTQFSFINKKFFLKVVGEMFEVWVVEDQSQSYEEVLEEEDVSVESDFRGGEEELRRTVAEVGGDKPVALSDDATSGEGTSEDASSDESEEEGFIGAHCDEVSTGEWLRRKAILCSLFWDQTYKDELVERSLENSILGGQLDSSDGSHANEESELQAC